MFDFANYFPYLLNRAGARLALAWGRESKPLGATLQEWRVLAALSTRRPQRMSELADSTTIDRTTLSRLVSRMEESEFVARGRSEDDGREVQIDLTAYGEQVTQRMLPLASRYETIALDGFSEAEVAAFKDMLKRVFANMDRL